MVVWTLDFGLAKIKKEIILEGFNAIYFFEFGKNFSHTPEVHNFWEMVYVDSGEIYVVSDGTVSTLKQGQAAFHKPMEAHSHFSNKKTPNNMIVVLFTCKSPAMIFFEKKIFQIGKASKKILSLFISECKNALGGIPSDFDDKSSPDFENAPFGSPQLIECYFTEFLLSLIRNSEISVTNISESLPAEYNFGENSFINHVTSFLQKNIYSKTTLDIISKKFSISKAYLCQVFKEATGYSPIDYYINMKIAEAKRLIRTDEHNITQIAYMLGYSSIHHFSRAFKNVTGFSPMSYKKSIK
jgi:AraC-like DNA-binding protein/quercetin dioxygenase-like cupin family protein